MTWVKEGTGGVGFYWGREWGSGQGSCPQVGACGWNHSSAREEVLRVSYQLLRRWGKRGNEGAGPESCQPSNVKNAVTVFTSALIFLFVPWLLDFASWYLLQQRHEQCSRSYIKLYYIILYKCFIHVLCIYLYIWMLFKMSKDDFGSCLHFSIL